MASDCFSRTTVVSEGLSRGTVELPPSFFEMTGIEPGHHVALTHGGLQLRARSKGNEMLKGDEVRLSPRLSVLLGVETGDILCVEDRSTFGDQFFDRLETVLEVLGDRAERLKELIGVVVPGDGGRTVEDALEVVVRGEAGRDYLVVTPNAPGSMAVQVCDLDPSQDVEVWDPDPLGKVKVFRPEPSDGDG